MANRPRHWTAKVPMELDIQKAPARFEAESWIVGQAVSARAALELLKYRADPATPAPDGASKPWPEFAEYDCFACHHDLHDESWRQERGRLKPGSLRRSDWYTVMPAQLAEHWGDQQVKQVPTALQELTQRMAKPSFQRRAIADLAGTIAGQLGPSSTGQLPKDPGTLLPPLIADYQQRKTPSWDEAAQLYLAAAALKREEAFQQTIAQMADALAYKPGYDSPKNYQPRGRFDELLKVFAKPP